jgi:hypothetical protein
MDSDLDDWRSLVDDARQMVDVDFGLRTTQVHVIGKTWASGTTGIGSPTVVDQEVTPRPRVTQLNEKDYTISGITPPYGTSDKSGGWTIGTLLPDQPVGTIDFVRLVLEDGSTRECRIVTVEFPAPMEYMIHLTDRK